MARKEKILVALSGGPASAIAASLLRNQDYDLIAVHAKVDPAVVPVSHCCPERDEASVTQLCEKLSIPLIIEDLTQMVEGKILAPMIEGRLSGRVLDPCIIFHSEILLPRLWEIAQKSRATQLASGHFARIAKERDGDEPALYTSSDFASDQSMLLSRAPADILARLQLPLSGIPETMMKKLAEELGLDLSRMKMNESSEHAESQTGKTPWPAACIPESAFDGALFRKYVPPIYMKPGAVRSVEEYTTTEHTGIGEARIGMPSRHMPGQTVLNVVFNTHTIIVGSQERLTMKSWSLHSTQIRRLGGDVMRSVDVRARVAGSTDLVEGTLDRYAAGFSLLNLKEPRMMPTPGQILVFYDQNEVVGSAIMGESPVKLEQK